MILVVINYRMKMIYYEPIKAIADITGLAKVIIKLVMKLHKLPELIISDRDSLFTLKF